MPKKKLNAAEKKERLAGDLRLFVQQYGRKAQRNWDPNDRRYDRDVEQKVRKHLKPGAMDALLRGEDDE